MRQGPWDRRAAPRPEWTVPPRRHPTLEAMEARILRARFRQSIELLALVLVCLFTGKL
jgi:hypothetical protein